MKIRFASIFGLCLASLGACDKSGDSDKDTGADDGAPSNCQSRCESVSQQCGFDPTTCPDVCESISAAELKCLEDSDCDQAAYDSCVDPSGGDGEQDSGGAEGDGAMMCSQTCPTLTCTCGNFAGVEVQKCVNGVCAMTCQDAGCS